MRSIGLFSSQTITPKGFARVMEILKGEEREFDWKISRGDRRVYAELASDEMLAMPDDLLKEVAGELGGVPVTLIAVNFNGRSEDGFEWQLARAVGIAFADHYPIVWHNYSDECEILYAPGERPLPEQ